MKIKVVSDEKNPVFPRRDVTAVATDFKATPSRKEVLEALCRALGGVDGKLVVLNRIEHRFGESRAAVAARVYSSEEDLNASEPKWRLARTRREVVEKIKELKAAKKAARGVKKAVGKGVGAAKAK